MQEKLSVGDSYTHEISFSQNDVEKFAALTNDTNPLHLDADFAAKTIFKKLIVPGYLSGAVFSKVFGTIFPGIGTIYLYQEMKFKKPVFTNEIYTAKFAVKEIDAAKNRAAIFCELYNSENETCIEGMATIMHPEKIC